MFKTKHLTTRCLIVMATALAVALPALAQTGSKPATRFTIDANEKVLQSLPFNDKQDFEDAQRGLVARPDTLTITAEDGTPVWDLEQYKQFIQLDKPAPDTVNPSLWRNAQLLMQYGLYKVTDDIYQVRGYDLTNITFVKGDTGWIVFDPLISPETAKAAYDLVSENLGERPVVAIVYSHSHIDHYGGAIGIVDRADVAAGKVQILAPEHFTEEAVSENVIAGNAMGRRAVYMYGSLLPRDATGGLSGGLGMTTSTGLAGLIPPTREITRTGEVVTIDGVKMEFQMTPGTEAPAEMNTWFPEWNALWMAENATSTMHNVLTLRGAQVRDALKWSSFMNETIDRYGNKAEVKFQAHHWPMWGNARIVPYLQKQGDVYKYIHDQSVRLMNMGYNGEEISERIKLPPELEDNWSTRGYYGSLRHNSRAVYQRYMGWYNGNPVDLNNLPEEMAAAKYVDFMGGEQALLQKARQSFDKGEYRWVAMVTQHAVYANPDSTEAKSLLADALEQMGYQAESGPWRSIYLQGAYELRNGVPSAGGTQTATPDTIRAMTPDMLFDYLAVRLDPDKASGKSLDMNINFTDTNEKYRLWVKNAVLNHTSRPTSNPDVTVSLNKETLNNVQLGQVSLQDAVANGDIKLDGDAKAFNEFMGMLDTFDFWFNVVTP